MDMCFCMYCIAAPFLREHVSKVRRDWSVPPVSAYIFMNMCFYVYCIAPPFLREHVKKV